MQEVYEPPRLNLTSALKEDAANRSIAAITAIARHEGSIAEYGRAQHVIASLVAKLAEVEKKNEEQSQKIEELRARLKDMPNSAEKDHDDVSLPLGLAEFVPLQKVPEVATSCLHSSG